MKQIKLIGTTLALTFALIMTISAQTTFDVPENIELKVKEDYAKYEMDIINATKWLEATDLDKEKEKRRQVNTFVMQWITGSPTINIDITEQLSQIYGKNEQLLLLYLVSYSRHFLENKATATKFTAKKAGLISIMNVYKKGIEISKSKEMEKIIKLTDDNKLDDYIKDKLK